MRCPRTLGEQTLSVNNRERYCRSVRFVTRYRYRNDQPTKAEQRAALAGDEREHYRGVEPRPRPTKPSPEHLARARAAVARARERVPPDPPDE